MKTGEDKNKKSGNGSKIVGALVTGAAVGLAAGILLAPEKGKKTRAKLLEDAKDLADKLKKKAGDGLEDVKDHADKLKKKAEAGIDSVADKK